MASAEPNQIDKPEATKSPSVECSPKKGKLQIESETKLFMSSLHATSFDFVWIHNFAFVVDRLSYSINKHK